MEIKKSLPVIVLLPVLFLFSCRKEYVGFRNGDIIFQTSTSNQSKAIQVATGSKYSHCGIVYIKKGKVLVYEASYRVKLSPIKRFVEKGEKREFVVKRLKNADSILSAENLKKIKKAGEKYNGLPYDPHFGWGDDKIYCSELIWKIYQQALNLEVGRLEKLGDLNLDHPLVQSKIKERYGNNVPLEETVISPVAIYNSDLLREVKVDID
jgi:hypothetical protein